jgi:glycosyltransferase involved in cell wall biosynthesis
MGDSLPSESFPSVNIVVVNDTAHVNGGASNIALGSAAALARRGHQITLFTAIGPIDSELFSIDNLRIICLGQHDAISDPNPTRAMIQGYWNRPAEKNIAQFLSSMNSLETIIHLHSWTKAFSASVVHKAISLGFPVVITLHDYFTVCPAGSFYNHPKQEICRLKPMSYACITTNCDSRSYTHKLWRVGRQWIQSYFGGIPNAVVDYISISDLSEGVLIPLLPPNAKIHRVRNFIDVPPQPAVDVAANTFITFSGRLSPEKGPQLLAECSRSLDLDVLFIGGGSMQDELAKKAPRSSFTGWVSPQKALEAMRRSRALVFPSLWYETQGLVVAEAAAIGVPAIVPTTCAAREWVEDGVTGMLFRGGDVSDLAQKIAFLHNHPEKAATMGTKAYEAYWQKPATVASHCVELEKVYSDMLGRRALLRTSA